MKNINKLLTNQHIIWIGGLPGVGKQKIRMTTTIIIVDIKHLKT